MVNNQGHPSIDGYKASCVRGGNLPFLWKQCLTKTDFRLLHDECPSME